MFYRLLANILGRRQEHKQLIEFLRQAPEEVKDVCSFQVLMGHLLRLGEELAEARIWLELAFAQLSLIDIEQTKVLMDRTRYEARPFAMATYWHSAANLSKFIRVCREIAHLYRESGDFEFAASFDRLAHECEQDAAFPEMPKQQEGSCYDDT